MTKSSRIPGFHREPVEGRLRLLAESGLVSEAGLAHLTSGGAVDVASVDRMSENVVAQQSLPFSVALNFRVNDRDVLVPMAVEEPSIVAAASNAAKLVRMQGGFQGEADPPVMTAQVQLDDVPDPVAKAAALEADKAALVALANEAIPRMVARGGGCVDLETRVLDEALGLLVVHLHVNVGDAMGANLVDTVAEHLAPEIQRRVGGRVGLRILTNLPLRRRVRVTARVGADALGGEALADGIVRASRFAELDPFRAVTHNKGIMNGIDAAAVALGQDWRSIEAGAHAYAALEGRYGPLATWRRTDDGVEGSLQMPMAVATVGGSVRAHPGFEAAVQMTGAENARELAVVIAAAGLACNLAALKALAGDGIQKGHMRLHRRKEEAAAAQQRAADEGGSR